MENILLTRDTLHSNIKLELSLVELVHSDSDNSGWLAVWLVGQIVLYADEVWCVKVLHLFKCSHATGSNKTMRSGLRKTRCNMLLEKLRLIFLQFLIITML